jgi:hypothetical protein
MGLLRKRRGTPAALQLMKQLLAAMDTHLVVRLHEVILGRRDGSTQAGSNVGK